MTLLSIRRALAWWLLRQQARAVYELAQGQPDVTAQDALILTFGHGRDWRTKR